MPGDAIHRVIGAYDAVGVRAYCWIRFGILRQRFLDEIGQYLPASGPVLDVGCGFGLFSLYYAVTGPGRYLYGIDVNARRIAMARRAAARLGLDNVAYEAIDARDFKADREARAAYMLDIIHHIEPEAVPPLLARLRGALPRGGRLLVKDVDRHPAPKRWFTWALDKAMSPSSPVWYWSADSLTECLEASGFRVYRHLMVDVLPPCGVQEYASVGASSPPCQRRF
jgi:SAM-dependent methyltransferase